MQVKKYLISSLLLLVPLIYVLSCNSGGNPDINNEVVFNSKLSSYKLFKGKMSDLNPSIGVQIIELSSTLFTDYAEKQRLIRIPVGKKILLKGNGLPVFPDGTLIAKTFYYHSKEKGKQIVETRLLSLFNSRWNVATYKWNKAQNNAFLIDDGATVPVKMEGTDGKYQNIAYHIPSKKECVSCHHSQNSILPIGPKARNLNRNVKREGRTVNQLEYMIKKGVIESIAIDSIQHQYNYQDTRLSIEKRARAYLDINCAHCHQNDGYASNTTLVLDINTNLNHSGIKLNGNNIVVRMNEMGDYHMPKLGTTIVDKQGVQLIKTYILSLK